ncbi:MAG: hypothetical protein HY293_10680 [Planctomycetes bacterium]|nr:hypothetical protein [Planctomycetota bacterium]
MVMPLNGIGEDDRAFDALIVLAFLEGLTQGAPVLSGPEPELDPADQRALDALGPDLARRILEEDVS